MSRRYALVGTAALAAAVAACHGWAVWDGLFLDDHLHQLRLRTTGWGLGDLLGVTRISPETYLHAWWQERPTTWQYARPLATLTMKALSVLSGGNVALQHLASILMHLACTVMVWRLCWQLTGHRLWALVGGLLFGMYTHTIITVSWLASQNAVLQTALCLAAVHLYVRASGLRLRPDEAGRSAPARLRRGAFAGVCACLAAALLARENAVVLPLILLALDAGYGGGRFVRARWPAHVLLFALAAAWGAWRFLIYYEPLPEFYARRPGGDGYLAWCAVKLLHYVCSTVWLTPMTVGPTGRFDPLSEVPLDCALMLVIVSVMGAGYWMACRRAPGWWVWPLWILLAVLPVTPILATPHTGYMAGVGFAVAMVLAPGLRKQVSPAWIGRWSPAVAVWFVIATLIYVPLVRIVWTAVRHAEARTIAQLAANRPPDDVTDLFFINLPFVNVYAPIQLEALWGPAPHGRQYHVLTFAPELLRMEQGCRVEWLDERRLGVTVEGRPWFSGALGRFLVEGMRASGRLRAGQRIPGELFDVIVEAAEAEGVRRLVFEFRTPLSNPRWAFYLGTAESPAAPLRFAAAPPGFAAAPRRLGIGQPDTHEIVEPAAPELAAALRRHDAAIDRLFALRSWVRRHVATDLYFTGPPFPGPR